VTDCPAHSLSYSSHPSQPLPPFFSFALLTAFAQAAILGASFLASSTVSFSPRYPGTTVEALSLLFLPMHFGVQHPPLSERKAEFHNSGWSAATPLLQYVQFSILDEPLVPLSLQFYLPLKLSCLCTCAMLRRHLFLLLFTAFFSTLFPFLARFASLQSKVSRRDRSGDRLTYFRDS